MRLSMSTVVVNRSKSEEIDAHPQQIFKVHYTGRGAPFVNLTADMVNALVNLVHAAGVAGTIGIISAIIGLPCGAAVWRAHLNAKARKEILEEKEKEIQRVSGENSEYKKLFFEMAGMTADKYGELRRGLPPRKTLGPNRNSQKPNQLPDGHEEDRPALGVSVALQKEGEKK